MIAAEVAFPMALRTFRLRLGPVGQREKRTLGLNERTAVHTVGCTHHRWSALAGLLLQDKRSPDAALRALRSPVGLRFSHIRARQAWFCSCWVESPSFRAGSQC